MKIKTSYFQLTNIIQRQTRLIGKCALLIWRETKHLCKSWKSNNIKLHSSSQLLNCLNFSFTKSHSSDTVAWVTERASALCKPDPWLWFGRRRCKRLQKKNVWIDGTDFAGWLASTTSAKQCQSTNVWAYCSAKCLNIPSTY